METHFNWKTKLFNRRFEIYQNDSLIGDLQKEGWSRKITGSMNSGRISFLTKGFFKQTTQILNLADNLEIGQVLFSPWKRKATINYQNKMYNWQYDNFFKTKWSISNENGLLVRYSSRAFKGIIDSYTKDEVLILTGFFIRNYLKQRAANTAAIT